MPGFTKADVLAFERAAAAAWPADRTVDVDGWTWRGSGGGSRRANSVLPLAYRGQDVDASVAAVERLYAADGCPSYFQVTSIAEPAGLDQRLAALGYTLEEPCLLLARRLQATPFPPDVEIAKDPGPEWLEVYGSTLDEARRAAAPAVLARVPRPRAFFLLRMGGKPISAGLGVLPHEDVALVECMATLAAGRRSGGASTVLRALMSWAADQGARRIALQVVAANAPAVGLYTGRGFAPVGGYHYRVKRRPA